MRFKVIRWCGYTAIVRLNSSYRYYRLIHATDRSFSTAIWRGKMRLQLIQTCISVTI
jgi:hypothetical protein